MVEILEFEFMRNALMAGLCASILCGVIGTLIVVNRLVFLSGGIAHSAYGGIGLAYFFGWPYMMVTTIFALCSALLMAAVSLKKKHRADTVIGVMWALGMAIGILALDLTPGYNVDLMSYLFGSILTVPRTDLMVMAVLGTLIILTIAYFFSDFVIMSYDEEFALIRGVSVIPLYFLLIGLVTITVVMVVQVVGLILVIALLTIPPHIAEKYTKSILQMMLLSCALGMLFIMSGLLLSFHYDFTSGATIIFVAGIAFFCSVIFDKAAFYYRKKRLIAAHN